MEFVFVLQILFIVFFEISFLLLAYRLVISKYNFQVWKERITDPDDTTFRDIMEPIIMETSAAVSEAVLDGLEFRYRQQLGTMTRVAGAEGNQDELSTGMMIAENVLLGMGMKKPSVQLVSRLASSMMGLVGNPEESDDKLF